MEKNLVSMAREIEKLRAEHMSLDKRTRGPGNSINIIVCHSSIKQLSTDTFLTGTGAYGGDMGYPGSFGDGYGRDKGLYGAGSWGSYETRGFPRP